MEIYVQSTENNLKSGHLKPNFEFFRAVFYEIVFFN